MIFKMARDRTEDGRDVKRGAVIKDNYGRLITASKEVLRIWAACYMELLNGKGAAIKLSSSVRREVEVEEIGQEEVETAMHKMKKGKATGADEVRLEMMEIVGEVVVNWAGRMEKAFDTVRREMVMATLRWMGVGLPEAEVRMVDGMYEKTTARVVVGEGTSEEQSSCCSVR